jgi:hypothetical protein
MSASNPDPRLNLEVRCADSATEVFVIDGQFNLRDRGIGHLKTLLEPGIYKVKVRAGFETREHPIVLRDHDESIDIPPFDFVSPAPLDGTSKTHEFHIQAAHDESLKVHLSAGKGSAVFIFARDWTGDTAPVPAPTSYENPSRGLSLQDLRGNVIADLTTQGKHYDGWEPWAACNIEVNPGCYLLSLKTPADETLNQVIVAAPGWQTQVFLLQREYEEGADKKRADVQGAAILMAPSGQGFDPASESLRLAELARVGLLNGRRVLSDDVRKMLNKKFQNPMLGIFGAHLLLLDPEPDLNLLNVVVTNLRALVSGNHPDVEALALKLDPSSGNAFDTPPMLRKSWTMIVGATAKRADLIRDGSIAEEIGTHLWGSHPWLIWMKEKDCVVEKQVARAAGVASEALQSALSNIEAILQSRLVQPDKKTDSPPAALAEMKSGWVQSEPASLSATEKVSEGSGGVEINEDKIEMLVHSMNIPRKNLEKMIASLSSHLAGSGDES